MGLAMRECLLPSSPGASWLLNKFFPAFFLFLSGCSFGSGNIQTKFSSDLETRRIRRIAVVSPAMTSSEQKTKIPFSSISASEAKPSDQGAPEVLARLIYSTMAPMSGWQIVADSEVREIGQSLPGGNEATRLRRIGEMVYADAVLTGRILRYRERVGNELGAKSPASVAFVLELVDVRRGDVIWSARFDETQRSLSENIFAIGDVISQGGVKWLTAEQLTHEGVKKAIAQLHQILIRNG
jgi:TolB-like protein